MYVCKRAKNKVPVNLFVDKELKDQYREILMRENTNMTEEFVKMMQTKVNEYSKKSDKKLKRKEVI